jgi:hypothetical protein
MSMTIATSRTAWCVTKWCAALRIAPGPRLRRRPEADRLRYCMNSAALKFVPKDASASADAEQAKAKK